MSDLVSVLMPSFNSQEFICGAIDSVIAQSYTNWELLITDDHSSDNSLKLAIEYAKRDPRIHVFMNEFERGTPGGRNTSLKHAQGRFIAFLDSDDQWKPFHLEKRIQHMLDNEYEFTYSWYELMNVDRKKIGERNPKVPRVSYKSLLIHSVIGVLVAIYDTKRIGKMYFPNIFKLEDRACWLRVLKKIDYAYLYPEFTASYMVRKGSISSNKLEQIKYSWMVYRDLEQFGFLKSLYLFSIYLINYFSRKAIYIYRFNRRKKTPSPQRTDSN